MKNIVVVVPSIRPESHAIFKEKWADLFKKHKVTFITVWDGDDPLIECEGKIGAKLSFPQYREWEPVIFNKTDSVRNFGFLWAACNKWFDYVITLDDDVYPIEGTDPIADLIEPLHTKVSISWFNTLLGDEAKVRGFPYEVRAEAEVQVSHAGWIRTPDYDGPTQLYLTPKALSEPQSYQNPQFYKGPIPRGVYAPFCGMAVAVTKEVLPHFYYAPMGPKAYGLNRFGDIWLGVNLKRICDENDWAIYYGNAMVDHSRASDVFKNLAQEAEGLRLNEKWWKEGDSVHPYFGMYKEKRLKYQELMESILR